MNDQSSSDRLPTLQAKNGQAFANSREVALFFSKQVKHVHRDIRELLAEDPELRSKFGPNEINDLTGRIVESYDMDRYGFVLLVMGYSGPKAHRIKRRFLDAFDAMEAEINRLRSAPPVDLNDPATLRGLLLTYSERAEKLEGQVKAMLPNVQAFERIAAADGTLNCTEAAKALQVKPQDLFKWLSQNGWVYRRTGSKYWLGYQSKVEAGFLTHKVTTVTNGDGGEIMREQVRITPHGLARLAKIVPGAVRQTEPAE